MRLLFYIILIDDVIVLQLNIVIETNFKSQQNSLKFDRLWYTLPDETYASFSFKFSLIILLYGVI